MTTIVTSGKKYIDIDAYASMLAYRELLRAQGCEAYAQSTAQINHSVPPLVLGLKYHLDDSAPLEDAEYILVDVSNPEFFDTITTGGKIAKIVDHHTGFEEYWRAQGVSHQIEFIGAVCTLIFEKIMEHHKPEILDTDLCKLLMAGILDNTLNLRASITTERDISAYQQLQAIGQVPESWREDYLRACDAEIMQDYKAAILGDLKVENVAPVLPQAVGQLLLSDATQVNFQMLAEVLSDYDEWVVNVISLNDGKSYLYFSDDNVKARLEKLFDQPAENNNLLILDQFLLRKQIMKMAREQK